MLYFTFGNSIWRCALSGANKCVSFSPPFFQPRTFTFHKELNTTYIYLGSNSNNATTWKCAVEADGSLSSCHYKQNNAFLYPSQLTLYGSNIYVAGNGFPKYQNYPIYSCPISEWPDTQNCKATILANQQQALGLTHFISNTGTDDYLLYSLLGSVGRSQLSTCTINDKNLGCHQAGNPQFPQSISNTAPLTVVGNFAYIVKSPIPGGGGVGVYVCSIDRENNPPDISECRQTATSIKAPVAIAFD